MQGRHQADYPPTTNSWIHGPGHHRRKQRKTFRLKALLTCKAQGKVALPLFGKTALPHGDRMANWKFYGRREQLADLERMLDRKRWFFAKVTGRRRIGKTALIQQAMAELGNRQPVFYVQIPDSEPVGVLSAVNDALETFQVPADRHPRPNDLRQLAKFLEAMEVCRS